MDINNRRGLQSEDQVEFCMDVTCEIENNSLIGIVEMFTEFKEALYKVCPIEYEEFWTEINNETYGGGQYTSHIYFTFKVAKENKKLIEDSEITEFF